jgi:VWFA-related protein
VPDGIDLTVELRTRGRDSLNRVLRPVLGCVSILGATLLALDAAPSLCPFASWSNSICSQDAQNVPGNTLKIDARLVPVRVVVRDAKGQAIGGLTKDDFRILDNGQEQVVSQFFADHSGGAGSQPVAPGQAAPAPNVERIYTAYLIDDLHVSQSDPMLVKDAASRHFDALDPAERAAIFTTSGQRGIDFTQDRDKLKQTMANIKPLGSGGLDCPKLNYVQADAITSHDEHALDEAAAEALNCEFHGNPKAVMAARSFAQAVATEIDEVGRGVAERSVRVLKELIGGMSKAPGRSTIVVVSDGIFLKRYDGESGIEDLAIRGNVTVNLLDPRGLQASAVASRDAGDTVLGLLAYDSGGTVFRNDNDLNEGFRRLGGAPEYSYVLAFSPGAANLDGKYHKLKVKLTTSKSLEVQARDGYFAAKPK